MKAIVTKYLPATNTKPARIKASAEGVKSEIYSLSSLEDVARATGKVLHEVAARRFARSRGWPDDLASGGLPDGQWAHCFRA